MAEPDETLMIRPFLRVSILGSAQCVISAAALTLRATRDFTRSKSSSW